VIATLSTLGTERQTSATVSADGRFVAGSMSFTFAGSGSDTRMSPFSVRFV
jgi:hypothetical protein